MNETLPESMPHDWPPIMPWREFAAWTRNDPGIVRGWIDRGYLPTTRIGKHVQVNLVALVDQLRATE